MCNYNIAIAGYTFSRVGFVQYVSVRNLGMAHPESVKIFFSLFLDVYDVHGAVSVSI